MKKLTFVILMALVAISMSCWAEGPSSAGNPEPQAPPAVERSPAPAVASNAISEEVAKKIKPLTDKVAELERAVRDARSRGNDAATARLTKELVKLQLEVLQLKNQPFGGFPNQMVASACLQGMGYRTRGQLIKELDGRYVSVEEYEAYKKSVAGAANQQASPAQAAAPPPAYYPYPAPPAPPAAAPPAQEQEKEGGTNMSQWSFIGWTLACVPALAIIGAILYFAVGNLARFTRSTEDLVEIGTKSKKKYDVRGDYGPFRVRYRDS